MAVSVKSVEINQTEKIKLEKKSPKAKPVSSVVQDEKTEKIRL